MTARLADPEVLIVGAGPVGLAASIELGLRGIRCLVVERNDRTGYSPRAKTTNVRTREHLRRWGIADDLRRTSPVSPDRPPVVIFATRMNGHILARFDNAMNAARERNDLYAEEAQWVPQYILEDVLRRKAQSIPGVEIRFQTEMLSFEQSVNGVVTRIRNRATGGLNQIESAYLIGADGPRSVVRSAIGATMQGDGAFSKNFSIIFRAPDLNRRQTLGGAIMYWLVNDEVPSMLGAMDEQGLWSLMVTKLAGDVDPADLDPVDLVRRAVGMSDLAVEIVGTDLWVANRLIADTYGGDRVFLAGDACHLHPPFGGFGMNMGLGDAVDLGWKLAARLRNWGGEHLLATYEFERRQVHARTVAEAVANFGTVSNQLVRAGLEDDTATGAATRAEIGEVILATKQREFKTLGLVLGARYADSPIAIPDGTAPPPEHTTLYVPSAHPGCLAPHLWLGDGSSLYDHFGPGFTLLATDGSVDGTTSILAAATRLAIPANIVAPRDRRLRQRYEARYCMIRPDQHVAWRGDNFPTDTDGFWSRLTGR